MNTKQFLLAGCAILILSAATAQAGPCNTVGKAASTKDAVPDPLRVILDKRREPAEKSMSIRRPVR